MASRLILVRHGRSAHVHDGSWVNHASARRFIEAYDAASIRPDDEPPPELIAIAREARVVVASDLPRAVASIRRLAPDREAEITPLLRELDFDLPKWGPRLPLDLWDSLYYVAWTSLLLARADTAETRRADLAAEWLESHCSSPGVAVAVTHGG